MQNAATAPPAVHAANMPVLNSPQNRPSGKALPLEWTDLSFRVGDRVILDNVSGAIRPGTLTAVLGPSGAGKSTLMNLLAGRQRYKPYDSKHGDFKTAKIGKGEAVMTGTVTAAGSPINLEHFRGNFAYVMQDDAFVGAVTPAEAIRFSAMLRKGEKDKQELEKIVNSTIDSLRLQSARDTKIGDALHKGISGGEKKRTAIGVELVTNPKILFLDEPLSGLDSYAAFQTMQVLLRVAGRRDRQDDPSTAGKVRESIVDVASSSSEGESRSDQAESADGPPILLTVHQPSSMLMSMFDDVIVLIPGGRVIYHGPVAELSAFFLAEHNEQCPDGTSPTDFIMFLIQVYQFSDPDKLSAMADKWATYQSQKLRPLIDSTRQRAAEAGHSGSAAPSSGNVKRTTSFFAQLAALSAREAVESKRRPIARVIGFFISAFLAMIYGGVYWGVGDVMDDIGQYQAQLSGEGDPPEWLTRKLTGYYGAMVVLCISTMMGSAQTQLLTFPLQRSIFLREYSANMYSVPAYFISKMVVELPVAFLNALGQMLAAYWMMGLRGSFLLATCVLWLLGTASASTALMVSSAFSDPRGAAQALVLVQVPQMLFSGLFLSVSLIPSGLRWLQYVSYLKYGINLFYIAEAGEKLPSMADANDITYSDAWLYFGIILAITVVSRVIAMFTLKAKAGYVF